MSSSLFTLTTGMPGPSWQQVCLAHSLTLGINNTVKPILLSCAFRCFDFRKVKNKTKYSTLTMKLVIGSSLIHGLHHHHRDAKRLAGASRRCDRSPERSVLRQLQGLGRCYNRVAADLVGPSGRRSATGASPLL